MRSRLRTGRIPREAKVPRREAPRQGRLVSSPMVDILSDHMKPGDLVEIIRTLPKGYGFHVRLNGNLYSLPPNAVEVLS